MNNHNQYNSECWEHAKAYASLLGEPPSSFTTAIRQLKADSEKGSELSKGSIFQAKRLCNSPSLGASLIAACKSYFSELNIKQSSQIVTTLPAEGLAGLIGVAFYYRKGKKLASQDDWPHYTKFLPTRVDLSVNIGKFIKAIGITRGVLIGAIDTIALTAFHLHDKKGFTEYRRSFKNKGSREDLEYEINRWGCNRYHVGAMLIQSLGFGIDFANEYANGMQSKDEEEKYLKAEAYKFRIGRVWLESLDSTSKEPDRAMRVEFYPDKKDLADLLSIAKNLSAKPPTTSWLDTVKLDESAVIEEEPE